MTDVNIYTSMFCGYCYRAKSLLNQKGVDFEEIDVTMDPVRRNEMISRAGGARSVPQIFVGDTHVGGCDELFAMEKAGELDPLLGLA